MVIESHPRFTLFAFKNFDDVSQSLNGQVERVYAIVDSQIAFPNLHSSHDRFCVLSQLEVPQLELFQNCQSLQRIKLGDIG
jgi:hypothetical protein